MKIFSLILVITLFSLGTLIPLATLITHPDYWYVWDIIGAVLITLGYIINILKKEIYK